MNQPLVSVLLPAYNAAPFVGQAIDSVLTQSYENFELLVFDDGSADNTWEIIANFSDVRIKKIRNEKNIGLIATLNKGIKLASGTYLARMDADDIAFPQRLEKQVHFMEQHPEVVLCGTAFICFGNGEEAVVRYPTEDAPLRWKMLYQCPFGHPTVMMRLATLHTHNLYYAQAYQHCEDFELWTRLAEIGQVANLSEVLLKYRLHEESVSQKFVEIQQEHTKKVLIRQWAKLGVSLTQADYEVMLALFYKDFSQDVSFVKHAEQLLAKLVGHTAAATHYLPQPYKIQSASLLFYHLCYNVKDRRFKVLRTYFASKIPRYTIKKGWQLKLVAKKIVETIF